MNLISERFFVHIGNWLRNVLDLLLVLLYDSLASLAQDFDWQSSIIYLSIEVYQALFFLTRIRVLSSFHSCNIILFVKIKSPYLLK